MFTLDNFYNFLNPNLIKVILFLLVLLVAFVTVFSFPGSNSPTPIFGLLFFPITILVNLFQTFGYLLILVLILPYSYVLASVIFYFFNLIRKNKPMLIFSFILLFFLLGFDEGLVNATVNLPNYSCNVDSDCSVKSISRGFCGNSQCVNQTWQYYDSRINVMAFATSCRETLLSCSCVQNTCKTKDLYVSKNISDCDVFNGLQKERCIEIITANIQ